LISYADKIVLREDLLNQVCRSKQPDLIFVSRVILELQEAGLIETWESEAPRRKTSPKSRVLGIEQQEVASEYLVEFESRVRPAVQNGPELTSRYVDARSDFWHLCVAQMLGCSGIVDTKGHSELANLHELYKHDVIQKRFVSDLFERVGIKGLHHLPARVICDMQNFAAYLRKELDQQIKEVILQPDPPEKIVSRVVEAIHEKYVESLNELILEKSLGHSTVETVVDAIFDITGHFLPGLGLVPALSKYAKSLNCRGDTGLVVYLTKLRSAAQSAGQHARS
jgi:hypothetical protein